jgi:hypothetical protein
MIACPLCKEPARGFNTIDNHIPIDGCKDGYDVHHTDTGMPVFVPRSAERETVYVPGRQEYRLIPCNHQMHNIKSIGDDTFEIDGITVDEATGEIRRVKVVGTFI